PAKSQYQKIVYSLSLFYNKIFTLTFSAPYFGQVQIFLRLLCFMERYYNAGGAENCFILNC
ncbi:hypothetical protein CO053_02175, partial [Candidatus Shapirobacteria bacterium CG_4_9_14_0_2_um_filter_40_11]